MVARVSRAAARALLVLALVLPQACRGPAQPYTTLGGRAAALKHQFNADAGKTRVVILPAPN